MKIFAITIPRAKERHAHINKEIKKKSIRELELVGIDGQELRRVSSQWPHSENLTVGEVGCAMSHARACSLIAEQGLSCALIVEDDVILPDDIDKILDMISLHIRPDEVISLYNRTIKAEKFSIYNSVSIGERILVCPLEARVMRTTAAYVIGSDAARKIAELNVPVNFVADNWDAFHRSGAVSKYRLLHPVPVKLYPFVSTLSYGRYSRSYRIFSALLKMIPFSGYVRARRRSLIQGRRERNIVLVKEPSVFSD